MFGKIVSLLGVTAALFLAGCMYTSSFNPPFDEKASYDPQEFCGNWVCKTDETNCFPKTEKTRYDIAISPFEGPPPNAILIQIVETPEKPEKDFGKWAPLVGRIIKIKEKYFLAVRVAVDKMLQDAQYNTTAFWMLSPQFYLLELTRKDSGFDLQFVSSTASNVESRRVWLRFNVLVNSTQEIQNMLENGEYALKGPIYHIIRK